jgi:hypothetical protein
MTSNKLTEAQLLFRLSEFFGAEQDATAIGDYEFAHECADVVSIIRELQEYRKAAGKPVLNVLFKNGWPVDGTTGIIGGSPSLPDGYHDFYATCQPALKGHQIRDLVNQLRDVAIEYHGTQQLRERIASVIRAAMSQGDAPFSFDVEKMQAAIDSGFDASPDSAKSFEEFDQAMRGKSEGGEL